MNNIVRTKTKTRSSSLTARRQDLPIEVTSDRPLVARPNNLPGMGRTNGQLMAGMNDTPLDDPLGRREVEQPVTTMPAVISKALSTSRQGVKAFQMANIIGQWPTRQRAQLERAGRDLFSQQSERKLTMADIFTVSSLTNSETEVKKMAAWVCRHCVPKQRDIQYSFPSASGYQPKAEVWDGDGVRFLLVRETPRDFGEDIDPDGDVGGRNLFYIYGWDEPSANAHRLGSEARKALTESKADEVQSIINFAVDYYYDIRDLEVVFEDVYERVDQLGLSSKEVADVEKAIHAHLHLNEAIEPDAKDKERAEKWYSSARINAMAKAIKDPEKALRRGVAFSRNDRNSNRVRESMGKTFICVGEGRVEIIEGAEAMSADALEGNKFIVNPNYRGGEDEYRFYGKLDIGRNTFKVDPGLSGRTRLETNVDFGRVVYAIRKQTIDAEPNDFWATWQEV